MSDWLKRIKKHSNRSTSRKSSSAARRSSPLEQSQSAPHFTLPNDSSVGPQTNESRIQYHVESSSSLFVDSPFLSPRAGSALSSPPANSFTNVAAPSSLPKQVSMTSTPFPLLPTSTSTSPAALSPAISPPVHPVQTSETTTTTFRSKTQNIAIKSLKIILVSLKKVLDDLPVPGAVAIDAVIELIEVAEKVEYNRAAQRALDERCAHLMELVVDSLKGKKEAHISSGLKNSISRLADGLLVTYKNAHVAKSGIFLAAINNEDDAANIEDMSRRITQLLESFSLENHIAGAIAMQNILNVVKTQTHLAGNVAEKMDEHELTANIESLPFANAAYNSSSQEGKSACFEGTRIQVLSEIANWISSEDALSRIYILDGIAGIGKTAIAKTIADRAAVLGYLGASFFFSRNEGQRKTGELFFSTIAYQLAHYDRGFKIKIGEAIGGIGRNSIRKRIQDQLQELLVRPLGNSGPHRTHTILIVVDALDECKNDDATEILRLLVKNVRLLPRLKFLVTTRPEGGIIDALRSNNIRQILRLHDIEDSVVETDVRLYLEYGLSRERIQNILPNLEPPPWEPTRNDINALVRASGKLFIIATTAVKFILDALENDPELQLAKLLKGVAKDYAGDHSQMNALDDMYLQILRTIFPDDISFGIMERFRSVVGAVIMLEEPLPPGPLANLIGMRRNHLTGILGVLHSIIGSSRQDSSPRIHHKSFIDFITHKDRCTHSRFLIAPKKHHTTMAIHCLRVMNQGLHRNICNLKSLDRFMDNYDAIRALQPRDLVREGVSLDLEYACKYWGTHLKNSYHNGEVDGLLIKFASDHLLHWLEALSWLGRMDSAYPTLQEATEFTSGSNILEECRQIFCDGSRLIPKFYEVITRSALHVYYSALSFTPRQSFLMEQYGSSMAEAICVVRGVMERWNPLMAVLHGHSMKVRCLQFSPDGSRLASGSHDSTVRLWDGATGATIATLKGHSHYVTSLAFLPDSSRFASGSFDNTVRLWEGATGESIATLEGHSDYVTSLAFSPDGSQLASGSHDNTLRLWDGVTGAPIATLKGHLHYVTSLAFSPDGSRLASGSDDNMVRLWDGATGTSIATLEGHSDIVTSLAFSPDGSRLASGSDDNTVRLWDSVTGASIVTLEEHSHYITSLAFTPDGSRIASGSSDKTVRLWDGATRACVTTLERHSDIVTSLAYSPDGSRLASGASDKTVRLWDGATGAPVAILEGHSDTVTSLAFSPDGSRIASGSDDKTVRLWGVINGASTAMLEGHSRPAEPLVFTSNESRITSRSNDSTKNLWDSATGTSTATVEGHTSDVTSLAFSPDGSRLASGSGDSTVRLWDGVAATSIAVLEGHSGIVTSLAFSPEGSRLASGSSDKSVRLYNGATGASIATLERHSGVVTSLAFSPDGSRLASGSSDKTVRLWDGATGAFIVTLEGHSDTVTPLSFSPDGSRLASGSFDKTVRLWDGDTGAYIAMLEGHSAWVRSLAFSPDGSLLASGSNDSAVMLWNGTTGVFITALEGHSREVTSLAFSPDGSRLASRGADSKMRIWNVLTDHSVNHRDDDSDQLPFAYGSFAIMRHGVLISLKRLESGLTCISGQWPGRASDCDAPLLWLPSEVVVRRHVFGVSSLALGCKDGNIVVLDLTRFSVD